MNNEFEITLSPTGNGKWSTSLEGTPLVTNSNDPEFASCRVLEQMGLTGRAIFKHLDGTTGLTMSITKGAKFRSTHSNSGAPILKPLNSDLDTAGASPEANDNLPGTILAKAA